MAAQQSQGIQTLLDAEKEAAKVVTQAREYRNQRIKEARSQAADEIEKLKQNKEKEFQAFEAEHSGDTNSSQSEIDRLTDERLVGIKSSFEQSKDDVVKSLLQRVIEVKPQLHQNYVRPS